MAPLHTPFHSSTKSLSLLFLFALLLVPPSSSFQLTIQLVGRRNLLEKTHLQDDSANKVQLSLKKKQGTTPTALGTTAQSKNKTKLITPKLTTTSTSNSTKIQKLKEKTIIKKLKSPNLIKPTSKTTNSTQPTSKTTDSTKPTSKNPPTLTQKSTDQPKKTKPTTKDQKSTKQFSSLTFLENDDEDDFITQFRDLPTRFQETFIPDLEMISKTSQSYLNKANKHIYKEINPIVGKKYAPIAASFISLAFILIPFLLVSLIFNRIKSYFSLQKLIVFIQIYLSIYFSILSLSSLVTGLEPLKFFYATSQNTYVCLQLLQTLAYVLYLLILLMYLVLVFSTESSIVSKVLGIGQTFVGLAVGLHYYITVFHRAVLRQAPKTSWKVHGVYATCFLFICLLGTADRRKKAYVVDGSEEEKKN